MIFRLGDQLITHRLGITAEAAMMRALCRSHLEHMAVKAGWASAAEF
jgi:hypothetical protein